jgi:methylmalonyl-CoA mutase N-terminal domain/subunit
MKTKTGSSRSKKAGPKSKRLEWEKECLYPYLEKIQERKDEFKSISNKNIERIYTQDDLPELNYSIELGFPGEYPFTRGVQPTMYRGRLWTMRQYAGFGSADDTNKRFKYLLEQGQTGLSVAFDLPTQMGYDSDHPLSMGEVGRVGVSIDSLNDMKRLFYQIPLQDVSTSMTINSTAPILLGMYVAVAQEQGGIVPQLRGTIQNDVLKEYVARGTYIFPPGESLRLITDIFEFCSTKLPKWNAISVSGYHIREAGSTAVQEIGFTLANALTYLNAAKERGLDIDMIAPQMTFFFNAQIDLFEEIAKYRAARRLWAKIMKERFEIKNPNSLKLRFHTQTAGSSLTAQQPEINIIRTTLEAMAAVLGGTQSLHTNSMDEAIGLPSEKAARIALRTQQIIGHESGVINTIDPLSGSYFIERLTAEMEEEALELIEQLDKMGGVIKAIENGFIQREIHESAYNFQKQLENKSRAMVGVNYFEIEEHANLKHLKVSAEIEKQQCDDLMDLHKTRSEQKVSASLNDLENDAVENINLMPSIIACVKNKVTLGEITQSLKDIFGEYKAPDIF